MGSKSLPPLPPPIGRGSKAVFEYLLKAQELDNRQVYGWVKSQAAFIRSYCAVKLHSVALVDVYFLIVVYPRYPKHYDSFRLDESFQKVLLFISGVLSNTTLRLSRTSVAA